MKYIRTKDGKVIDIHQYWSTKVFEINPDENYWVKELLFRERINKEDCKVFDTIEELCDEFVVHGSDRNGNRLKPRVRARLQTEPYTVEEIKIIFRPSDYNKPCEIYGAIWTNKGLIYVAKMNDKGELELL